MNGLAQLVCRVLRDDHIMYGNTDKDVVAKEKEKTDFTYVNADDYANVISRTFKDPDGCHHGVFNLMVLLKDELEFFGRIKQDGHQPVIDRALLYVQNEDNMVWKRTS